MESKDMGRHKHSGHEDIFKDILKEVEPIRFREPFAETLGAFKQENAVLEYSFIDVVKMAGHACPTTAGAYLSCQQTLKKLYPDKIPFARDKAKRLGQLLQKVIWEAATHDERREFQDLWMEKVEDMLLRRKKINQWLKIEEGVR
jgi:hypothetical protein